MHFAGCRSIKSKALSSDTSPHAVREHRFFAKYLKLQETSAIRLRTLGQPLPLTRSIVQEKLIQREVSSGFCPQSRWTFLFCEDSGLGGFNSRCHVSPNRRRYYNYLMRVQIVKGE